MLDKIKRILFTIIGVIYFLFALCMTILLLNYNDYGVTQFGETQIILVKEDLALNNYKKGDLVFVKQKQLDEIAVGDIIFAYKLDGKGKAYIEVGRVGELYAEDNALAFENGETYSMDFVAGEGYEVHPKIGTYLSIIESQWGFLFIVLVPIFLIFIYQVYELILEIKYGAEETN